MKKEIILLYICTLLAVIILPHFGLADVEGTLTNIQDTLISRLMPIFGALGLCFAAFSFISGNPNAKNHATMAIIGALIGFGAPSIIEYARGMIN